MEGINKIEMLSYQMEAILDLMQSAGKLADVESFNTCAELVLTMQEDLMDEVRKLWNELRTVNEGVKSSKN